jgi:hypothetical protein
MICHKGIDVIRMDIVPLTPLEVEVIDYGFCSNVTQYSFSEVPYNKAKNLLFLYTVEILSKSY